MIKRIAALLVLAWALGFALFVVGLPRPADAARTDAIVVPTGGAGRIERGLELIQQRQAKRMLVTGVNRDVRASELALVQNAPPALFRCCVDLGREAVDTRSNGAETARWLKRRGYRSLRLVTSDWHMRRARHELRRALDPNVVIISDAVRSRAGFGVLFTEYHKYLLSMFAGAVGL